MGDGDGNLIVFALTILFIVGGLVPYIMSSFIDETSYNYDGYLSGTIDFVQNGITLDPSIIPFIPNSMSDFLSNYINFPRVNPFSLLGANIQNFLVSQIQGFTLIPNAIGIPLLIIIAFCIMFVLIKLIKPFS